MDDAPLVRGLEPTAHLNPDVQQLLQRQRPLLPRQAVAQGLPFLQLHHHEGPAFMLAKFKDRTDVGMVERRRSAGFAAEALQRLWIAAQLLGQKLERNLAAQLQVLGAIDHAHAAPTNDLQHAVVRNRSTGWLRGEAAGWLG
jgi:hypothetical protein